MFSLKKVTAHSKLHNTLIKLLKEKKEESEAEEESCGGVHGCLHQSSPPAAVLPRISAVRGDHACAGAESAPSLRLAVTT
jgi:hypothetical protein